MTLKCPACSAPRENDPLLLCPGCHKSLATATAEGIATLESLPKAIVDQIYRAMRSKLLKIFGITSIVGAVAFVGTTYQLYYSAIGHIDNAIADQFAKPFVDETLRKIVTARSDALLRDRVDDEVRQIRSDFERELADLRTQSVYLREIAKIDTLKIDAMFGEASVAAWEELGNYSNDDKRLESRAKFARREAQSFYAAAWTPAWGVPDLAALKGKRGTVQLVNEPQPLSALLSVLSGRFRLERPTLFIGHDGQPNLTDDGQPNLTREIVFDHRMRASAARALSKHRCLDALQALVDAVRTDPSIGVRKSAQTTLRVLTAEDYGSVSLIGDDYAAGWWEERGRRFAESLPQCDPDATENPKE